MKRLMLINVLQPEECRIAVLEDGTLEELYVERTSRENLVGNIYKGRIVNIEPSIQAAFVDFGIGRNGFLHVSDVDAHYYRHARENNDQKYPAGSDRSGDGSRPPARSGHRAPRMKPPIQDIFKRGQEVLVQVIKDSVGNKGPTLSTYISIPGRYLVLMPGLNRVGVSRKIENEQQRRTLRELLKTLSPPKGLGIIVRTAGLDRSKRELSRDLTYLTRVWKVIVRRINKSRSPAPIYVESDLIIRTIRDIFTSDIDEIWVDEPEAYEQAKEFLSVTMPRYVNRLKLDEGKEPLFYKYGLEQEIARIQQRQVPLPEGGSIVIDQTEALVAIDVNSGSFRADDDAEETAFRINMAAAKEIARQLRLRDLGGVIVSDFIDMRDDRHRRQVEETLRQAVKRDRARTKILRMSPFCLVEMTRQRIRPSLKRSVYQDCPTCHGTGQVKSPESLAIEVMRTLQLACAMEQVARIEIDLHQTVAQYLNNRKRVELAALEQREQKSVSIRGLVDVPPEHFEVRCLDASGVEQLLPAGPGRAETSQAASRQSARSPSTSAQSGAGGARKRRTRRTAKKNTKQPSAARQQQTSADARSQSNRRRRRPSRPPASPSQNQPTTAEPDPDAQPATPSEAEQDSGQQAQTTERQQLTMEQRATPGDNHVVQSDTVVQAE